MKESKLYDINYVLNHEENRMTNFSDENASMIWNDETEEYIIIFWFESWEGNTIVKVKYTGCDDYDTITERLYNQGYME